MATNSLLSLVAFNEYSRVPNKGGGGNNRGGWKWFDIAIIGGGAGIIGGGVLGEIENSRFLR